MSLMFSKRETPLVEEPLAIAQTTSDLPTNLLDRKKTNALFLPLLSRHDIDTANPVYEPVPDASVKEQESVREKKSEREKSVKDCKSNGRMAWVAGLVRLCLLTCRQSGFTLCRINIRACYKISISCI
jgi:hypothetical protein